MTAVQHIKQMIPPELNDHCSILYATAPDRSAHYKVYLRTTNEQLIEQFCKTFRPIAFKIIVTSEVFNNNFICEAILANAFQTNNSNKIKLRCRTPGGFIDVECNIIGE